MANTKDTLIIVPAGGDMSDAKFATGRTVTADEITKYGLTLAGATNAAGFTTGEIADSAGAITTQDDTFTLNPYAAATAGEFTVEFVNVADGEELFVTIVDVTNGRRQFPRATFSAFDVNALASQIDGMELETGDGLAYSCSATVVTTAGSESELITIDLPDDVIAKVAANDDATITETTAPILSTGIKAADAAEFVASKVTKAGRTNRVGFPIVEPGVYTDLGLEAGADYDVLTRQIVGDVKFDKNFGANYQDVENVTIIVKDGITLS